MTVSANTHIILDVHSPKKDAVIGEGAPTVDTTECAIWANAITAPEFTTQTTATWRTVFRELAEALKQGGSGILIASGPIDGSASEVVLTAPGTGEIGIYAGFDLYANAQTHFVDRTVKRLLERWLELAKTGIT